MRLDRNHEGYHDPTVSKAIESVSRKPGRSREGHGIKPSPLTYLLREVKGFKEASAMVR